jgi:hypothetical protein
MAAARGCGCPVAGSGPPSISRPSVRPAVVWNGFTSRIDVPLIFFS